jgi:hypothetical protein
MFADARLFTGREGSWCPLPCLQRIGLDFSHVEMDWPTQQVVSTSQTFGLLQAEDIDGSGGPPCTSCMDTSPYVSRGCPHQHYR